MCGELFNVWCGLLIQQWRWMQIGIGSVDSRATMAGTAQFPMEEPVPQQGLSFHRWLRGRNLVGYLSLLPVSIPSSDMLVAFTTVTVWFRRNPFTDAIQMLRVSEAGATTASGHVTNNTPVEPTWPLEERRSRQSSQVSSQPELLSPRRTSSDEGAPTPGSDVSNFQPQCRPLSPAGSMPPS